MVNTKKKLNKKKIVKNIKSEQNNRKFKNLYFNYKKTSLLDSKLSLYKYKSLWRAAVKKIIEKIKNKKILKKFFKIFKFKVAKKDKETIDLTSRAVLEIKNQRFLRRKKYKIIALYRRYQFHTKDLSIKRLKIFKSIYNARLQSIFYIRYHYSNVFLLKRVLRFFYGFLHNKVWNKTKVIGKKKTNKLQNIFKFLEYRLEVFLYRCHFTDSYLQARQLIRHGFIFVNNFCVKSKHFIIDVNDIISINKRKYFFKLLLKAKDNILNFLNGYILNKNEIFDNFFINYRILHGMIFKSSKYLIYFLLQQFPKNFFGKQANATHKINFHKLKRKKSFMHFARQQKKWQEKELQKIRRFDSLIWKALRSTIYSLPKRNVKIVMSFNKTI